MSDALTPNAPVEGAAVPEAPAPEVAVEGASAGAETPPNVVDAARFNGLMSKYQSEKSEWEQRVAAMESELNSLRAKEQEKPEVANEDVSELKAQVAQLAEMLMSERQDAARSQILDQYPDAKPFADLIVGGTPDEMELLAKTLHDRMQLLKGEVAPSNESQEPVVGGEPAAPVEGATGEPAAPAAPEHGGAVPATGVDTLVQAKNDAIAKGDFEGFLAAASQLQEASMAQVS